jgi:hypothetical protein
MAIVAEYDWESDTFTNHAENAARKAWREAVAAIADKARQTLPECNGRVDRAVQMVLNHDVELLEDGKARVASQSNGQVTYHVVNGGCECRDYTDGKAPSGWCKHRIAAGLYKRATALIQRQLHGHVAQDAAPVQAPAQEPAPAQPQAQGLCPRCGKRPPPDDGSHCVVCLTQLRERYAMRQAQGLCPVCGKRPPYDGYSRCIPCMTRQNPAKRHYYSRQKEARRQGLLDA